VDFGRGENATLNKQHFGNDHSQLSGGRACLDSPAAPVVRASVHLSPHSPMHCERKRFSVLLVTPQIDS